MQSFHYSVLIKLSKDEGGKSRVLDFRSRRQKSSTSTLGLCCLAGMKRGLKGRSLTFFSRYHVSYSRVCYTIPTVTKGEK